MSVKTRLSGAIDRAILDFYSSPRSNNVLMCEVVSFPKKIPMLQKNLPSDLDSVLTGIGNYKFQPTKKLDKLADGVYACQDILSESSDLFDRQKFNSAAGKYFSAYRKYLCDYKAFKGQKN